MLPNTSWITHVPTDTKETHEQTRRHSSARSHRACTDWGAHGEAHGQGAQGLAEYHDLTLGDLLEGIVLYAFESRSPFHEESLRKIAQLKEVYGMNYGAEASHRLTETQPKEERK